METVERRTAESVIGIDGGNIKPARWSVRLFLCMTGMPLVCGESPQGA